MSKIWFTSDLHFCHNKPFVYEPRGFSSIEEMNETIVSNFNSLVGEDDDVYILGDLMLIDNQKGMEYINKLNGNLHIILGNHDGNSRIELYKECKKIKDIQYSYLIKYRKYQFYLSHYPVCLGNYDMQMSKMWCLHGHTHFKEKFGEVDKNYNVALDAHNCFPIEIEDILLDIQQKWNEIYQKQIKFDKDKNF